MPEKILGLDISSDSIAAVQVSGGLRGYHITGCGHVMIEDAGGLVQALKAVAEQVGSDFNICISSIPVEYVSFRNLRMPFRDRKKIRQTLVFELETRVPFPVEDLVVDLTMVDLSDRSEILAASVKRAYISEYLAQLHTHGFDPEVLDIKGVPTVSRLLRQAGSPDDGLLLEIGLDKNTMILYLKRRIVLIRSFSFNGSSIVRTVIDGMGSDHAHTEMAGEIEPQERASESENDKLSYSRRFPAACCGEIQSCLEAFCTEVRNTLHAFGCQSTRTIRPQRVFVTGRGALYPDTESLLSRFLDLPIDLIDLTKDSRVYMEEDVDRVWNPALMDGAFALAVREARQGLGFNFRRDEFEVKKHYFVHKKEILRASVVLIVVLCLLALDLGVDYYSQKKHYRKLNEEITQVFRQTFPDTKRIVDPVHQMEVKIDEIKKSALLLPEVGSNRKVLDLLKDISQRVPESGGVHISRIVVDPDSVQIKGETDTFNTVDAIKKGLEPSTCFSAVTISSANLDRSGNRVRFEMKLQRGR